MQQQQPPPPPRDRAQLLRRAAPSKGLDFSTWASQNLNKLLPLSLLLLLSLAFLLLRSSPSSPICLTPRPLSHSRSNHPSPIPRPHVHFDLVPAFPLPSGPTSSFRSPNWIVLSVASTPPDDPVLLSLSRTKSWQLLALGDADTPSDWSLRGAIFLSLDEQAQLGYRIVDHLPYRSHLRKSVGYLFAIQHGAVRIFDANPRADIINGDLNRVFDVDLAQGLTILRYARRNGTTVVNPYVHFGQRSVWPRGLPLHLVGQLGVEETYEEAAAGQQFIQQGLSDGLPDVDSVFYFTRKSRGEAYDVRFDGEAPKVAVPPGVMVPVNSLNTLFHREAFWGLMLPVSVSTMASDVMRGYWAQRMLWEIGGYVAVYPPTMKRVDRSEAYPFADEKDLHVNVGRLIDFLVSWRSDKETLFERILDLSWTMAEEGFWKEQDVRLTADWLQDLIGVGYQQPKLMPLNIDAPIDAAGSGGKREFIPRKLPSVHLGVKEEDTVSTEIGSLVRWRKIFGNVVLIVYCSGPPDRTALEWRLLYGRIFKTVVILSEKSNENLAVESGDLGHAYKYLPKIFDRFPQAEGFIFLQDSMILNYWNLLQADKTRLWIADKAPGSWTTFSIDDNSQKWTKRQAALVKKLVSTMPVHFQVSYKDNFGEDKFALCGSEIFYVPRHFVTDFQDLVGLVGDMKLHHKIAVPLFFVAMDSPQNFDSDALRWVVYKPDLASNTSCSSYYSAKAPAVFPCTVRNEPEFINLIRMMAEGDPLLMELV